MSSSESVLPDGLCGREGIRAECVPHSGQKLLGQVLLEARRRYAQLFEERGSGSVAGSSFIGLLS